MGHLCVVNRRVYMDITGTGYRGSLLVKKGCVTGLEQSRIYRLLARYFVFVGLDVYNIYMTTRIHL